MASKKPLEWNIEELKKKHLKYPFLCELLLSPEKVKPYFDFDMTYETAEELPSETAEIYEKVKENVVKMLKEDSSIEIATAYREVGKAISNSKKERYKISLRLWITNRWTTLEKLKEQTSNYKGEGIEDYNFNGHMFDNSIYKDTRQMMNFVGKAKGAYDSTRILKYDESRNLEDYVIQYIPSDVKELEWKEIEKVVLPIVKYKKANKHLNMPALTDWKVTQHDKGYKVSPICKVCVVNPEITHSNEEHSCVFLNTDKSVVKSCFSCGAVVVTNKKESKMIYGYFVIDTQENNVFQNLRDRLLEYAEEHNLQRDEKTGDVYEPVRPYAYIKYLGAKEFINKIFYGDNEYKSNVNNNDNLIKYMKTFDDPQFPFLKTNKDYLGFRNGVLNSKTCEFAPNTLDGSNVRKYFDQEFEYSMDTPLLDKILKFQFSEEVTKFIYSYIGRMFEIRDSFGFMLYLLGEPGCGKTIIIKAVEACFNTSGSIGSSYEVKYGLGYLHDKDVVISDDLPKYISKIFPQEVFQTIITGGTISTAVKNGDALNIKWKTPILLASNYLPDYVDKGQISRRMLIANFEKNVYDQDATLEDRIIAEELPALIYKSLLYYKELIDSANGKSIWKLCPEYFLEQQEDMKIERNPLYKFLVENTRYKEGNKINMSEIKNQFSAWINKNIKRLDNGTFGQVNPLYRVETTKICKHCLQVATKECCEKGCNRDRMHGSFVHNIEFL